MSNIIYGARVAYEWNVSDLALLKPIVAISLTFNEFARMELASAFFNRNSKEVLLKVKLSRNIKEVSHAKLAYYEKVFFKSTPGNLDFHNLALFPRKQGHLPAFMLGGELAGHGFSRC